MATSEDTNSGGGMSVREAGKRGGDRVKAKYGSEFYEAIGRKGGEATKVKYGPTFYEEIGAKRRSKAETHSDRRVSNRWPTAGNR